MENLASLSQLASQAYSSAEGLAGTATQCLNVWQGQERDQPWTCKTAVKFFFPPQILRKQYISKCCNSSAKYHKQGWLHMGAPLHPQIASIPSPRRRLSCWRRKACSPPVPQDPGWGSQPLSLPLHLIPSPGLHPPAFPPQSRKVRWGNVSTKPQWPGEEKNLRNAVFNLKQT